MIARNAGAQPVADRGRVTVDVVSLSRMRRLDAEHGPALERMLLHPSERVAACDPDRLRCLAASLGTKESWIKARAARPAGWTFDRGAFSPCEAAALPVAVHALIDVFVADLEATTIQAGTVRGYAGGPDEPADGRASAAHWAWHGIVEDWLVSAVVA